MKKNLVWCYLLLKRLVKNPAILLLLIGMPVLAYALTKVPAMQEESVPKVGVYVEDEDEISVKTIQRLLKGDYYAKFYEAESEDQLTQDVLSGKAECAYVFRRGLTDKLDQKQCSESIILVRDSAGVFSTMMNEIVFSALFQTYGQKIATNYVEQSHLFQSFTPRAVDLTNRHYERYLEGTDTFYLEFEDLDSSDRGNNGSNESDSQVDRQSDSQDGKRTGSEEEQTATVFPVRGVLALLVFLAGLTGGVMWMMDQEAGVLTAMPYHFRLYGRIWYILIPTMLFSISAELTLAATKTAVYPMEAGKMFLYVIGIAVFTCILTLIIRRASTLMAVTMVLLIGGLLLCPIFIDLSSYLPFTTYFSRLLLPYYYLI